VFGGRAGDRRRGIARGVRLGTAVVALALAGVGARILAGYQWERVTGYATPFAVALEPGSSTEPLTARVVVVVIEGLRQDVAATLPTLRALGAQGVSLTARASQPSLALPAWTELLTGAPPDVSGVTTDRRTAPAPVDSVLREVTLEGGITAVAGGPGWRTLFGDWVAEGWYGRATDAAVGEEALRLLQEADPSLLVVHLSDVDRAGHAGGVGDGYRAAAQRADAVVSRMVEVTEGTATLVVTSGHGHVDQGGHGGPEPEVLTTPLILAGPGVRQVSQAEVSQADVAPTVAALLGVPRPVHALGRPLSLLDAGPAERSEIGQAHREVSIRFASRAAEEIGRGASGLATLQSARREEERSAMLIRLPLAGAFVLIAGWVLWRTRRGLDQAAVAAGAGVAVAVAALLFVARGLSFSLSEVPDADIGPFLLTRLIDAVAAGLVGGAVCGWVAGRRGRPRPFAEGLATAAWAMALPALGSALFFARFGWSFPGRLPDLSAVIAQAVGLVGVFGLGLTAAAVGLAATGVASIAYRRAGVE